MSNLDKITARFGRAYDRKSKAEKWLKTQQQKMFDEFTLDLTSHPLARRTVVLPIDVEATEYVRIYYPGWRLVGANPGSSTGVIEEDPALMKHNHVNKDTKMVYARTFTQGAPSLDDEQLRADDPELWERISEWPEPWHSLITRVVSDFTSTPWSDDSLSNCAASYLEEVGLQRTLKDLNTVSDNDLVLLQDYLRPGSIGVRLVPPRPAKPEELEEC